MTRSLGAVAALSLTLPLCVACAGGEGTPHEQAEASTADARDTPADASSPDSAPLSEDAPPAEDDAPAPDATPRDASSLADATGDSSAEGAPRDSAADAIADAGEDPCARGTQGAASDADGGDGTPVSGYGAVDLNVSSHNEIVSLRTTLTVPTEPPPSGTLFLWPGLQPGDGADFAVLNNGVLQPVLTWGPTCAPDAPSKPYQSWWISAQYVNTYITAANPNYSNYSGCHGGPGIGSAVGDALRLTMLLQGTTWVQSVDDEQSGQTTSYSLDMLGQAQAWAEFVIELYGQPPVSDVVFTSTEIGFADPEPSACQPTSRGANDYFAPPRASPDGRTCCISRIILRAQGVPATTPDGP